METHESATPLVRDLESNGSCVVQKRKVHGVYQAIVTATSTGHRYTIDHLPIMQRLNDGSTIRVNSGDTDSRDQYWFSPDERWLFVERAASNHFFYADLYHRRRASDKHFVPVRPGDLRLDEAALRRYAHQHRRDAAPLSGGRRYIHCNGWDMTRGSLFFTVAASALLDRPGDTGRAWQSAYNLRTGAMTIVKELKY